MKVQIGKCMSGKFNSENTDRKILIGKYQPKYTNRKIQIRKCKSENTHRNHTLRKIQIGNMQFGKYKSEKKCQKIQVGRIVGKVKFGTIYDIATLQHS